jgi:cytochrome c biogenesis protein CcdA
MLARQIAIGFGIAIVFPLLVYYGVASTYTPPKLPAYVAAADAPINPTPEERQHYLEQRQAEQQEQNRRYEAYEAAAKVFAGHLIYFATPLGICAIFLGAYLPLYAIGTGLIIGGIFTVGFGYWHYWQYLADWVRFVSLLAGFIILLFVGYYRICGSNTRAASP